MNEQSTTENSTTDPQTGLDKIFAFLRGIGVRRRSDDKWIAGVCSGLADRLGVDPVIVRAALVLLAILGGVGLSIYLVAWALLPNDKNEIAAERALRDGDGGSVVLLIVAAFVVFGGSWLGSDAGWGFPWGLAAVGLLIWWLVQRSRNQPDADQRVSAQQSGAPFAAGPSATASGATPTASGATPTAFAPSTTGSGALPTAFVPSPSGSGPAPATPPLVAPKTPRRRSGGLRMALLAIGLTLVTYGSLNWLGDEYSWTGSHEAIAMAGSLGAIGILLVVLGVAGWRAGFVGFLATILAISAFSVSVVPDGIHFNGRWGDATWKPTSLTSDVNYHLGAGDGVLDLRGLPSEGLSEAKLPAYVGLGELTVIVPDDLTVKVLGHVGLGDMALPGDSGSDDHGGADVSRSAVIGEGPIEVIVDAEVGVGQLTVVKE